VTLRNIDSALMWNIKNVYIVADLRLIGRGLSR
jgi:hypothetical protein